MSNYHWQDGIGPISQRPVRMELAWCALMLLHLASLGVPALADTTASDTLLTTGSQPSLTRYVCLSLTGPSVGQRRRVDPPKRPPGPTPPCTRPLTSQHPAYAISSEQTSSSTMPVPSASSPTSASTVRPSLSRSLADLTQLKRLLPTL